MEKISLYELGKMAQKGNEFAMLQIIELKKKLSKDTLMEMKICINL